MLLICESEQINDYLVELDVVNYSDSSIQGKVEELFHPSQSEVEKAKIAYEFVRDEIAHSWDIQGILVPSKASDVLTHKQGICYAKSNLLASLLRSQGIPTGFCYQRLMLFDTPAKGYSLHALNAVYFASLNKWVRLDARGNKPGVNAQFSLEVEKLAFSVNSELDEKDYPVIYTKPYSKTIEVLQAHTNALEMYQNHLPECL